MNRSAIRHPKMYSHNYVVTYESEDVQLEKFLDPNFEDFFQNFFWFIYIYMYVYICRFQNVFLRCPTPRLYLFLSSHWPSFRFLSFMAFLITSIQFFFGLPRALFCFGIHFNAILGNLPSAILWTRPCHVSLFCSISFIIVSSNQICCLIVSFLLFSFLDILIFIYI